MADPTARPRRRAVLQTAAVLALAQALPATAATPGPGKPGEFDFLSGEWRIRHRRLKAPGDWDVFEGEATCWSILGGVASIEELRIPARGFAGSGIRILDRKQGLWADYWVNARDGLLTPPPLWGRFIYGDGVFIADDEDAGKPIKVRGLWDAITPTTHRWTQAVSRDAGQTWDPNWLMEWRRA
jgi:hypothetical protein